MNKSQRFKLSSSKQDLVEKLTVVFIVTYLLLFGAEAILPGVVAGVFNLNWLLLMVFGLLVILFLGGQESKSKKNNQWWRWVSILLMLFLSLVLVIVLYKISLIESFLYLALVLITGKLLYELVR
jgi:hypothetical protein